MGSDDKKCCGVNKAKGPILFFLVCGLAVFGIVCTVQVNRMTGAAVENSKSTISFAKNSLKKITVKTPMEKELRKSLLWAYESKSVVLEMVTFWKNSALCMLWLAISCMIVSAITGRAIEKNCRATIQKIVNSEQQKEAILT